MPWAGYWFWQGLQFDGSQAGLGASLQGSQQSHEQPAVVVRSNAQAATIIAIRFMICYSSGAPQRGSLGICEPWARDGEGAEAPPAVSLIHAVIEIGPDA